MFFLVMLCNVFIVFTLVFIQNKCLLILSHQKFDRLKDGTNSRSIFLILGILLIHMAQVWVFAFAYYLMTVLQVFGDVGQMINASGKVTGILDFVYFSFTCFTTLGFGDITPQGNVRFITSAEAIAGFVLITWSASFLFIQMQQDWRQK